MPNINYFDMLKATVEKLRTCSFIDDPSKVDFSDQFAADVKKEEAYPLIVVEQGTFGPDSYQDQSSLEGSIDIVVQGFMNQKKKDGMPLKEENYKMIIDAGAEALEKIFSFNEDKQKAESPVLGFQKIEGSTRVFVDPQMNGSVMAFIFAFTVSLINITVEQ